MSLTLRMHRRPSNACLVCLVSFMVAAKLLAAEPFAIAEVDPSDGSQDVNPTAAVQVHFTRKFDAASITPRSVRLVDAGGRDVAATRVADLGGVVTISPDKPLAPQTRYTIELTGDVRSTLGEALRSFRSSFTTGDLPERKAGELTRFRAVLLDRARGMTAITVGPDGHVYAADWEGKLFRYVIDIAGEAVQAKETLFAVDGGRILGLAFDPDASAENLDLWMTYDSNGGMATTPQNDGGELARLRLVPHGKTGEVKRTVYVTGFPSGAHAVCSCVFGPEGRIYIPQGALTMIGGPTSEWHETLVSASILVGDVRSPAFNGGKLPLDIRSTPPTNYDPRETGAPLSLYATGIRQAYDLCWHSNGNLYAGVNMNDTTASTPGREGLPAVANIRPDEPLIRIKPGKYYGHPNPSQGTYVLMGGNPTTAKDAWEIEQLPVGTQPEPDFDSSLLVFNLAKVGGQSANGALEYKAAGPLQGRLLVCFYTSTRGIGTFELSRDGSQVIDFAHLQNPSGNDLKFGAPLDIAQDAAGRLYVADFSDPRRGDSGKQGGVWMLVPIVP